METELSTPNTRREKEVWQACDDLWAQNALPRQLTGDNIRDQLVKLGYKRGSPNEIYRYRNSWKDSRGISDASEVSEGDARASDPISRAVSLVYDQMRSQTSDAIDKLTQDYETRLKASLLEEETLRSEVAKFMAQNSALSQELANIKSFASQLEQTLLKEEREQAVLNERLKGAKDQAEMLSSEHKNLILELKAFHEREIDLWRGQNAELQMLMTDQRKAAKAETERQGALFSDELMSLKTELRQSNEERMWTEGKLSTLEQAYEKDVLRAKDLEELLQKNHIETLTWHRKAERFLQHRTSRLPINLGKLRRSKL